MKGRKQAPHRYHKKPLNSRLHASNRHYDWLLANFNNKKARGLRFFELVLARYKKQTQGACFYACIINRGRREQANMTG